MNREIPRYEPEVIAAAARRRGGDDDKVATTSIRYLDVEGVILTSRYDKAGEYEVMKKMVLGVHASLRSHIESIWCDSKANACYSVHLKSCSKRQAEQIAQQLEEFSGGHNGIYVSGERGGYLVLDPDWPGDEY